jgi:sugar O-acyltransferase (sialic acid O-acetyltransferase NeuD family)
MIKLYIIGAGQLGKLLYKEIKKNSKYKVLGFIDKYSKKDKFDGIQIYKNENNFLKNKKKINLVLAIGGIIERKKIIKKFKKKNFSFSKIILNNCHIENIKNIGSGSIIMTHTKILNNSKIGKYCLIGTDVNILHDVQIGNNCVIGGSSCIGANTKIENNVLVGVGSVFSSNKKTVGAGTIVCSGSVVHKDVKKNSKVIGNPFKYLPK